MLCNANPRIIIIINFKIKKKKKKKTSRGEWSQRILRLSTKTMLE